MSTKKTKTEWELEWKRLKFDVSRWFYDRKFKQWKSDAGFKSDAAALRYIVNQFFKDKPIL